MRKFGAETWLAATLFAASAVLAIITPGQVTGESERVVGPATLPLGLAVILALLSLLLLAGSVRRAPQPRGTLRSLAPVLVFTIGLGLYVAALPVLGYMLATVLLIVGLCLLFGERRWWAIAALAVLVPLALLLFFERFMIILLPGGLWT